jgi:hypothetical protein
VIDRYRRFDYEDRQKKGEREREKEREGAFRSKNEVILI